MSAPTLPELILISHRLCPYVQRARIVLTEQHIPHRIEFIHLDNKPDWFRAISPLGKVPVLLVDGEPLFESQVIVEYLDDIGPSSMLPADPFARARFKAWAAFASSTLDLVARFYRADDSATFAGAIEAMTDRFRRVDDALGEGPWFAGEDFSLVDAAFAPLFRYFDTFEKFGDFDWFQGLKQVPAWREQLQKRPSVKAAVVSNYPSLLENFLLDRNSVLSRLMHRQIKRLAG